MQAVAILSGTQHYSTVWIICYVLYFYGAVCLWEISGDLVVPRHTKTIRASTLIYRRASSRIEVSTAGRKSWPKNVDERSKACGHQEDIFAGRMRSLTLTIYLWQLSYDLVKEQCQTVEFTRSTTQCLTIWFPSVMQHIYRNCGNLALLYWCSLAAEVEVNHWELREKSIRTDVTEMLLREDSMKVYPGMVRKRPWIDHHALIYCDRKLSYYRELRIFSLNVALGGDHLVVTSMWQTRQ